jgi:hypothetical protein
MDAMDSNRLMVRWQTGWHAVANSAWTAALLCGSLIGLLAVSTSLVWTLTWSDDRAFAASAILMLACGLMMGGRVPLSRHLGVTELAIAACTWTLLLPWVIGGQTLLAGYIPLTVWSVEGSRLMIGLVCAIPVWFISGWLWSSLSIGTFEFAIQRRSKVSWVPVGLAVGVAMGIGGSASVLAPWIGAWGAVAVAVAGVVCTRIVAGLVQPRLIADGQCHGDPASSSLVPGVFVVAPKATANHESQLNRLVGVAGALALGGLLAVVMRLMGQMMPNGSQVYFAEWMGLAIGFALGRSLLACGYMSKDRSQWLLLVPAAASGLLLAALPVIVDVSLWANASLTSVVLLMAFRSLLLVFVTAPIGFAAAGSTSNTESPFARWRVALAAGIGFVATQYCFESAGLVWVLTAVSMVLVLLGLSRVLTETGERRSWLGTTGIVACSLLGMSVPIWRSHDNPAQTAKMLFSTPSFVAHRAGWESQLLPMLDDARAIDIREGLRGPLTVWRSHGLEVHLRENGIPRAVVSADTAAHPQFAPEVLQVVFPLVMAEQPNRILLLGASCGVPLTTCVQFPVHKVVCAESDQHLIDIIRGPIARETGFDPLADDRTSVIAVPPAMAVMTCPQEFDVILSSPASSSIVAGGAMFTVEHYRHASRCLATGGIFCQRFQAIDYGPDPLRMVVQSMRHAFVETIAIETAAGEFLLLGTNTPGAFVPDDLPARLDTPHVRRLLARSGLDWSALLNFPAYDHAALGEICHEARTRANSPANGLFALQAPMELMRWGPKMHEMQTVLTAMRTSPAPYSNQDDDSDVTGETEEVVQSTRKSRLLEWLGDSRVSSDLLRRLSEVATQYKLVREHPESHWWQYRKALREQLQNRPQSSVRQVSHLVDKSTLHPEDDRRKNYFTALGKAAQQPTAERIDAVAAHLQPYDPLISYFARQEIADLQSRNEIDPASELVNRLHVIYFAPGVDASTRNVAAAIDLLVRNPEAIADPARRFDVLNGLVQTLRNRWESRQAYPVQSPRRQLSDVNRSVVATDKAIEAMESIHADADISVAEWSNRKQVIDRMLLRPLHGYRSQLQTAAERGENRTRAMRDKLTSDGK